MRGFWMVAAAACAALAACGAPKFEKVPRQAMEMLKGARGKPFSAGLVFVNGAYQRTPYRIVRYGTALFVNDVQATGQIVPWRSFLATQDGYEPPAAPAKAAPPPKKSEDDLFDDAPAKKEEAARPAPEPEVAGAFAPNAKSDALLKKVNAARLELQRKLKAGYLVFLGANYARVAVEPRVARALMAVLPEAIRDAADGGDLAAALRAQGFPFMHRALCDDLVANRADYLQLVARRAKIQEDEALRKMFDAGAEGAAR